MMGLHADVTQQLLQCTSSGRGLMQRLNAASFRPSICHDFDLLEFNAVFRHFAPNIVLVWSLSHLVIVF